MNVTTERKDLYTKENDAKYIYTWNVGRKQKPKKVSTERKHLYTMHIVNPWNKMWLEWKGIYLLKEKWCTQH